MLKAIEKADDKLHTKTHTRAHSHGEKTHTHIHTHTQRERERERSKKISPSLTNYKNILNSSKKNFVT